MRAAQFHAARDIRLTTSAPTPTSPSANRVTIDIEWCGICGSDLHEYLVGPIVIPTSERGAHSITGEVAPITLGHEFCGRVAQLPDGYKGDLKVGAPVMVDPRINCRSCTACLGSSSGTNAVKGCGGRTSHLCKKWGFIGLSGGGGGLSEQVSVWADMCYALPDTPDILKNAALIEPLAVARHGVQRTEISDFRDKNVLILGGGPIGVAVVMDLKVLGVKQVIVSEPTETRQKGVAKLVDVVLNPKTEDVPERCRELTEGRGVDVVFDCAGVGPAMMNGMAALKTQGMYMNVAGWETPVSFARLLRLVHLRLC